MSISLLKGEYLLYSLKPPNLNAGYVIKEISDNPAFTKTKFRGGKPPNKPNTLGKLGSTYNGISTQVTEARVFGLLEFGWVLYPIL